MDTIPNDKQVICFIPQVTYLENLVSIYVVMPVKGMMQSVVVYM